MSVLMKLNDDTQWLEQISDIDPQSAEASDNMLELHPNGWFTPEQEWITLPSLLAPGEIKHLSLNSIAMMEAELHKAQVTDALEGLHLALGEKSPCFCTEVRNASSQRTTHRAWDNVHKLDREAKRCCTTYRHARTALECLSVNPEYLATLHNITDNDLKVAGDITDAGRFGQCSDTLPWFWQIGESIDESGGPCMLECMYSGFPFDRPTDLS